MSRCHSTSSTSLTDRRDGDARRLMPICLIVLSSLFAAPNALRADLVKLVNGGELRGKVIVGHDGKQRIQMETITGATVVIDRDQTQFVSMRSAAIEDYETRSRRLEDTWEMHWDISEWCRQKGLSKQRENHLLRVTELAPEHDKAQKALGREWHQGQWVNKDELMASQGYVKYKNKYITPQELEIIEKTADELQRERSWFQKVRMWHAWLDGSSRDRHQKAVVSLTSLEDPHAATAVMKFLGEDPRVEVHSYASLSS